VIGHCHHPFMSQTIGDGNEEKGLPVSVGLSELERVRQLRREDPAEAAEQMSYFLECRVQELGGNDLHPELAELWFEYGDLLLDLEESKVISAGGVVQNAQSSSSTNSAQGPQAQGEQIAVNHLEEAAQDTFKDREEEEEDEEEEDDLKVAWECLETARRCLELGQGQHDRSHLHLRSRVHGRLAEFLMLQERFEEAVSESSSSLEFARELSRSEGEPEQLLLESLARHSEALLHGGHADDAKRVAAEALQVLHESCPQAAGRTLPNDSGTTKSFGEGSVASRLQDIAELAQQHDETLDELKRVSASASAVKTVPVRKRPREHEADLDAPAPKERCASCA